MLRAALLAAAALGCSSDLAFPSFSAADAPATALSLLGLANLTGTRLRLTPPLPGAAGAVWASAPQRVTHGFTTDFAFRLLQDDHAAPASPCRVVDHAPAACERRGGDGFAFVLHTLGPSALGGGGSGLGYAGLSGIAVEFDTWADADTSDPGDNHLAVLTRGNATLRADHGSALGAALVIPDLAADGARHSVRITYSPRFDAAAPQEPGWRASQHLGSLVYPRGTPWRHGLGVLRIWLDDLGGSAALVVPLPLEALLPGLTAEGAATVGFTAATGAAQQAHEILSWAFVADNDPYALLAATAGGRGAVPRAEGGALAARWADEAFARLHASYNASEDAVLAGNVSAAGLAG